LALGALEGVNLIRKRRAIIVTGGLEVHADPVSFAVGNTFISETPSGEHRESQVVAGSLDLADRLSQRVKSYRFVEETNEPCQDRIDYAAKKRA
jgi:hypothetical protein